jgi:hypothetical protein
MELHAEQVDGAREPSERAGDRHRQEVVALDVDPGIAGSFRVEPDRAYLEPERGAVQDRPEDAEGAEGDEDPDVEALKLRGVRRPAPLV